MTKRRDVVATIAAYERVRVNRSRWAHLDAGGAMTLCLYVHRGYSPRAGTANKVCPRCKDAAMRAAERDGTVRYLP